MVPSSTGRFCHHRRMLNNVFSFCVGRVAYERTVRNIVDKDPMAQVPSTPAPHPQPTQRNASYGVLRAMLLRALQLHGTPHTAGNDLTLSHQGHSGTWCSEIKHSRKGCQLDGANAKGGPGPFRWMPFWLAEEAIFPVLGCLPAVAPRDWGILGGAWPK